MKFLYPYIIACVVVICGCAKNKPPLPFDSILIADSISIQQIAFATNSHAFAVGGIAREYGCIYKTTNGGTQWNIVETTVSRMNSVFLHDQSNGVFCGDEQEKDKLCIYRLENDSLINMIHTNIWTACNLQNIAFIDSLHGFIVGEKEHGVGYVYRTKDGAKTWQNERFVHFGFSAIDIFDSQNIVVSGHGGIVQLEPDGITHTFAHIENDIFTDITYISESVCVASGYSGSVYRSIDGGTHWKQVYKHGLFSKKHWNAIHFVNAQHGFICGENAMLLETKNGGASWELHTLQFNGDLNCVTSQNNVLYIGTSKGVILTIPNIL